MQCDMSMGGTYVPIPNIYIDASCCLHTTTVLKADRWVAQMVFVCFEIEERVTSVMKVV